MTTTCPFAEPDGLTVREGEAVVVSVAAANRDPEAFESPTS